MSIEGSAQAKGHKENSEVFNSKFQEDCIKVYNKMITNPFSNFSKLNSA